MEYLVLLAIVIIVALIAIVLLGGFTTGISGTMDAQSKSYWTGPVRPFSISEWAQINDTVYLEIKNKETDRLVLTNISFNGQMKNLSGSGWTFGPGSTKSLAFDGFTECDRQSFDYFEYNIVFYYDSSSISGRSQMGSKPIAGSCSFQ